MRIESIRVDFKNKKGEKLAARLDRPRGAIVAYSLFAHCFTCSKDIFSATRIAKGLATNGVATLRFDLTGLGQSEPIQIRLAIFLPTSVYFSDQRRPDLSHR